MKRSAYTVYGDPSNPVVIFLHGMRLGRTIWDRHARLLCDEFCVIATDLPGHAARKDVPFSNESVDAAVRELVAEFAPEKPPILVGYSLGGYVAGTFALRHPQDTAGIVLAGATVDLVGPRASLYQSCVALAEHLPTPVLDAAIRGFFRVSLPKRIADMIVPFDFDRDVFRATAHHYNDVPFSEQLRAYEKPVLIINGQFDPFRLDEKRYARSTQAPVAIIPWTDHVAPLRRPKLFSEIVRVFARGVFGAPRANALTATAPRSSGSYS